MTEERWGDFNFEEPQTDQFLNLPNSVMEHICRFLENTGDKYEACFIHPQWTTAAQNVLWEKPRFERPNKFRDFMITIKDSRKNALLVRDIYLAFLDREDTLFNSIVKSNSDRHSAPKNPLANPSFMSSIARTCEKLTALTVYGWNLDSTQIEGLASTAQDLTSLSIIGGNSIRFKEPLSFNSLLSRLTTLRLDGDFYINERWAESLITRASQLTCLQISLQQMDYSVLHKIMTPHRLGLTSLTLTDATHVQDSHVEKITTAFPYLTRLCLEGSGYVTGLSIMYAFKTCLKLTSMEIRADPKSIQRYHETDSSAHIDLNGIQTAYPARLLLENMNITNDQLVQFAPSLSLVQTLGFKNCPHLTNSGIKGAFQTNTNIKYLRVVEISNCSGIDSGIFSFFSSLDFVARSLFRIRLESSGSAIPKDIYDLCCAGTEHNLREIRLVNYDNIQQSIIGTFNERSSQDSYGDETSVVTLNRASIDALAHSTDPELCPPPSDRILSGNQILLLAKHFQVPVHDLVDLIERFEEETEGNQRKSHKVSFDSSNIQTGNKSISRLYALRGQSSSLRPTTPALWSNDFEKNNIPVIYGSETGSDETIDAEEEVNNGDIEDAEEDVTEEYEEDYDGSKEEYVTEEDVTEEDITEEEEEYVTNSHSTQNNNACSVTAANVGSEINLGGWGTSVIGEWNVHPKQHNSEVPFISSSVSRQSPPSQQKQTSTAWNGYAEENYKDKWQQSGLEVNNNKGFKLAGQKHYRNSPALAESDGWGSVKKYVAWDDVQGQGYVKDVIEQQQNTIFWKQDGTKWLQANSSSTTNNATEHDDDMTLTNGVSGDSTPAPMGSPPVLFSAIANGLKSIKSNSNINFTNNRKSNNNNLNNRGRNISPRPRSASLVSSDGSVSWDDDARITSIKLNNDTGITSQFIVCNKTKPDHPGKPRWSNAEDWKATKDTAVINVYESPSINTKTTTSTHAKESWKNHFSPEAIADKTAKDEWSTISNNLSPSNSTNRPFSRPPRTSNTRRSSVRDRDREHARRQIAHERSWGLNGNTPPSRSSTSSPPSNQQQPGPRYGTPPVYKQLVAVASPSSPSVMLIDTENVPSIPSRPTLKGDVWDSISSLDMLPNRLTNTNQVLVPQEVSSTKIAAPIPTESFNWPGNEDVLFNGDKKEESPPLFHFVETTSGTTTEAEIRDRIEQQKKDNLVDFEKLVALPSPTLSASTISTTPTITAKTIAEKANGQTKDDLLNFDDMVISVKNNNNKNNNLNEQISHAPNTLFTSSTTTATNTTTSATTTNTTATTRTTATTNNHNNNEKTKTDTTIPSHETSPETNIVTFPPVRLTVVPITEPLFVRCDDDVRETVTKYCEEHDVMKDLESIYKQILEKWTARRTKTILRKGKPGKKVSGKASPLA